MHLSHLKLKKRLWWVVWGHATVMNATKVCVQRPPIISCIISLSPVKRGRLQGAAAGKSPYLCLELVIFLTRVNGVGVKCRAFYLLHLIHVQVIRMCKLASGTVNGSILPARLSSPKVEKDWSLPIGNGHRVLTYAFPPSCTMGQQMIEWVDLEILWSVP